MEAKKYQSIAKKVTTHSSNYSTYCIYVCTTSLVSCGQVNSPKRLAKVDNTDVESGEDGYHMRTLQCVRITTTYRPPLLTKRKFWGAWAEQV